MESEDSVVKLLWPRPQKATRLSEEKSFAFAYKGILSVRFSMANGCGLKAPGPGGSSSPGHLQEMSLLWLQHQKSFANIDYSLVLKGFCSSEASREEKPLNGIEGGAGDAITGEHESVLLSEHLYLVKCSINAVIFGEKQQSYQLKLLEKDTIEMVANDAQGLHYAILTLHQLIHHQKGSSLPSICILDTPDFVFRGISANNWINSLREPYLESFISVLGTLKINQLFCEIDVLRNEGPTEEKLWTSLDRFCRKRFISLNPVYEVLSESPGAVTLSQIQELILCSHALFSNNRCLFLGSNVSFLIVNSKESDRTHFISSFAMYTIIFSDLKPEDVPFGCGLMSDQHMSSWRVVRVDGHRSLAGNLCNNMKVLEDKMSQNLGQLSTVGFLLSPSYRSSFFETSIAFQIPLFCLSAGYGWNTNTCNFEDKLSLVSQFMKFLKFCDFDTDLHSLGEFVVGLSSVESQIHPLLYQLLTNADQVSLDLNSVELFVKTSKQVRILQNQLNACQESESMSEDSLDYAPEALFVCDLMQLLIRLGRALCASGRNPATDSLGLTMVNMGLNSLSATSKTDIANKLLCLQASMKELWSIRYLPAKVAQNTETLGRLLDNLIPVNSDLGDY